jgi:hypothetical protein
VVAPSRARAGATIAEAIVALVIGLLVLQLGLSTLARFRAAQARLVARGDALVALRIGRHVLRRELRHGMAGRDWVVDADSVSLRAFRGTALVCQADSAAAEVVVVFSGERAPDATKDSVLFVSGEGDVAVRALVGVGGAAPCAGTLPGSPARWRLDRSAPHGAVAARLFERGSYHLSGAALRYRRGASGRQPLTPEVWTAATAWSASPARLGVTLVPAASTGAPWSGFVAWRGQVAP